MNLNLINLKPTEWSKEVWKTIDGFENYQVSNFGRVKSFAKKTPKILTTNANDGIGYVRVQLYKNKQRAFFRIHRLVAMAFIPNPENKPEINHKNGIKKDNRVENLEWATYSENENHARKYLDKKSYTRKIQCVETGVVYESLTQAAKQLGTAVNCIHRALNNKRKTYKKLHWRYL